MKCSEIIKILETLSPRSMACDWDNPGLLAGLQREGSEDDLSGGGRHRFCD